MMINNADDDVWVLDSAPVYQEPAQSKLPDMELIRHVCWALGSDDKPTVFVFSDAALSNASTAAPPIPRLFPSASPAPQEALSGSSVSLQAERQQVLIAERLAPENPPWTSLAGTGLPHTGQQPELHHQLHGVDADQHWQDQWTQGVACAQPVWTGAHLDAISHHSRDVQQIGLTSAAVSGPMPVWQTADEGADHAAANWPDQPDALPAAGTPQEPKEQTKRFVNFGECMDQLSHYDPATIVHASGFSGLSFADLEVFVQQLEEQVAPVRRAIPVVRVTVRGNNRAEKLAKTGYFVMHDADSAARMITFKTFDFAPGFQIKVREFTPPQLIGASAADAD